MSNIKDKLARSWASDLTERVGGDHVIYPQRRPKPESGNRLVKPPFSVLMVREMEQTTPGSNVWIAEVRIAVVCDKDAGDTTLQEARVEEIRQALDATPLPCIDEETGVRLYGFSLDRMATAEAAREGEKVFSDVFFLTAGAGDEASSPEAEVIAP